jgi:hypothetical protein
MKNNEFMRRQEGRARRTFINALFRSGLPPPTRHVLMTLCDRGMVSWPSEETLASETGLARRSVGEHLRKASREGWLCIEKRPSRWGRYSGNMYRLQVPDGVDQRQEMPTASAVGVDKDHGQFTTRPWANDGVSPGQEMPTNTKEEHKIEHGDENGTTYSSPKAIAEIIKRVASPELRRVLSAGAALRGVR